MQILQRTLSFHHFFTGQMDLYTFDFLVNSLFIVLSSCLYLLLEEFLGRLLNLFKVIIEIFVKHTPVKIIKNSKFDGTNSFQSVSLCFLLFNVQQVHWLTVWSWYLGQERKSTTINISEIFHAYTVVLFII